MKPAMPSNISEWAEKKARKYIIENEVATRQQAFLAGANLMWERSCIELSFDPPKTAEQLKTVYPVIARLVQEEMEKYFGCKDQLERIHEHRNGKPETVGFSAG